MNNATYLNGDLKTEYNDFINTKITRRQVNRVLHSHPSLFFWNEKNIPISEVFYSENKITNFNKIIYKKTNLYIAFPYCLKTNPDKCGYCLFPSETYKNKASVEKYFEYFQREGQILKQYLKSKEISSIYCGGGTPNILPPHYYSKLLKMVKEVFINIPDDIEITLEGIPSCFTIDKIHAIKEAGFNRISIGVQQFNNDLIALSGRKQKTDQIIKCLQLCDLLGLKTNVDIIFGWPNQTIDSMLSDLQLIVDLNIKHITHYELNIGRKSYFGKELKDQLPSIDENLEMYRRAKFFLENNGYAQSSSYDWEKITDDNCGNFVFEKNMRTVFTYDEQKQITGFDMLGWGFAGISYFLRSPNSPGWSLMNSYNLADYYQALDNNELPIYRAYHYTVQDLKTSIIFQGLQNLHININEFNDILNCDIINDLYPIWDIFSERGWVHINDNEINVIGDGGYFTSLMQKLIEYDHYKKVKVS